MSGTTPRLGLVYATAADPVTNYPATNQQGQTQLDTALSRYLSGVTVVNGTNVAQTPNVHVTFPAGRYTLAPVLVLQAAGTSFWLAAFANLTKDGVDIYAATKTGAASTATNLQIHWQATPGQTVRLAVPDLEDDSDQGGEDEFVPLPDPVDQLEGDDAGA